jgi:7-cyano-7-deazaguanine synthase
MNMEMALPVFNVLWTGGWDSTYRILYLSRHEVELRPHYIYYENRRSRDIEIKTMEEISKDIQKDPKTKCTLRPLTIIQFKNIEINNDITQAFKRIRQEVLIGYQYEYLARYAGTLENLEIGVEQGGLAEQMMNTFGEMIRVRDELGMEYWKVNEQNSSEDLNKVFGLFKYPLYSMTKLDMKEKAIELGFINSMYKTWFCHFPRKGKPCGCCFPCNFTIEDGLPERLPKAALKRHKIDKRFKNHKIYQLYKKYRRKYLNY